MTKVNITYLIQKELRLATFVKTIGVAAVALVLTVPAALGADFKVYDGFQKGLEAAKSEGKPLIVDYYTDWCKYCKQMDTITFVDPDVVAWINENVVFAKINCEDENGEKTEFAKSQGVMGYPTLALYNSDGEEIDRDVSFIEPEKFVEIFDDFLNGKNTLEYFLKKLESKSDIENNWAVANKYRWRGETKLAEKYFNTIIEMDPVDKEDKTSESLFALADMKRREKVYDSAIERYERLIDKFPASPLTADAVIYIAICHRETSDTAKAIAQFGKFIQLYPQSEDVEYASRHIRKLIGEGY